MCFTRKSSCNFYQILRVYDPPSLPSLRIIALKLCIFFYFFVPFLLFLLEMASFSFYFSWLYFGIFKCLLFDCPQCVVFLVYCMPLIPTLVSVSLLSGQKCGAVPTAESSYPTLLGHLLLRAILTTILTVRLACGPCEPPPAISFR